MVTQAVGAVPNRRSQSHFGGSCARFRAKSLDTGIALPAFFARNPAQDRLELLRPDNQGQPLARTPGTTLPARLAIACLAVAFVSGCADDTTSSGVSTAGDIGSDCQASRTTCDIAQTACQREILTLTACVRGDATPALPPVRVITQDQFRAELTAAAKKANTQPGPWDTALSLLGLVAPGTNPVSASIDDSVQSIAAYYSDQTKNVTIIDASASADPQTRMYVLSHELTHYLQDHTRDLGKLRQKNVTTFDSVVAFTSLVEGDAVVSSTRVLSLWKGRRFSDINWDSYFGQLDTATWQQIAGSPTPLNVARESLPYPVGGRYIASVWDETDRAHVEALFTKPELHLVDWLAGYGNAAPAPSLAEDLACAPPLPVAGLVLHGLDSLGPAGLIALLISVHGKLDQTDQDLSRALVADALEVDATTRDKTAPQTPVAVAWRLRFQTPAIATNAVQALTNLPTGITVTQSEAELLLTASDTPTHPWPASALASCPALTDLMPNSPAPPMNAAPRPTPLPTPLWLH